MKKASLSTIIVIFLIGFIACSTTTKKESASVPEQTYSPVADDEKYKGEDKTLFPKKLTSESLKNAYVPNTHIFTMHSKFNKRDYRIYIYFPWSYFNNENINYPVLYLLDARGGFFTVVAFLGGMNMAKELPQMMIVGIDYPTDSGLEWAARRVWDYTPTSVPGMDSYHSKEYGKEVKSGGASQFLTFIRKELIPLIESNFRTNSDKTFMGFSYGGLFGMYTLFTAPETFDRYLIGSPSLWWDQSVIFEYEGKYYSNKKELPASVFISSGELEYRNRNNVKRMVDTLKGRSYRDLKLSTHIFENETHWSGWPTTYNWGIRELFKN
jgi:predicted alpha/beta superfamily hydrolase